MKLRRLAIVGLGEAGTFLAGAFKQAGVAEVKAYDILYHDAAGNRILVDRAASAGARLCASSAEAVRNTDLVISTVTADQAVVAAREAAAGIAEGQVFLDLNSTSPLNKNKGAGFIAASGARFVDGVAMDALLRCGIALPILLAGPAAGELSLALNALGLNTEAISEEVGAASTVKLLRSVVVKGLEALLAESLLGASHIGEVDRVLASLSSSYPGLDWPELARYHLERMARHGGRRARELEAAADTLVSLNVDPFLARAVAARQKWSADLGLKEALGDTEEPSIDVLLSKIAAAEAGSAKIPRG